jgi:arylsulfatase A-like enzyme
MKDGNRTERSTDVIDKSAEADEMVQGSRETSLSALARPISRRRVLQAGAGLAAALAGASRAGTVLAAGEARLAASSAVPSRSRAMLKAPNIIVLMTDQERHHMHWPKGWAEKNLPSLTRLRRHGLYFNRAYTAAAQCSPSRAAMLTSRFAPVNRIERTFLPPGLQHQSQVPNIGSLLRGKAGYEVVWKGKWHLSYATNAAPNNGGEAWTAADIRAMEQNYGWSGWNPPDAGNAIQEWQYNEFGKYNGMATLGGGIANNDGRFVKGKDPQAAGQTPGLGESAIDFLKHRARKLGKPFCLFISLVNPHDVYVYPGLYEKAGYRREDFANLGIGLPPNANDDLSTKPSVQKAARASFDKSSPLEGEQQRLDYVNFYAYLQTVVDRHISMVLDTLEETRLMDNTIIFRCADHGEGGLSHGMREKAYTAYEEMIHVPLIVHNRRLFPEPAETSAFYDHLDLLPTVLELAGVPKADSYGLGKSAVPIIKDPSKSGRSHTLFAFDDSFFLPVSVPGGRIRAIREGDWTYAVYFGLDSGNGLAYELYDNKNDPGQLHNLLFGAPAADVSKEWARLHRILTDGFMAAGNLPGGINGFAWPIQPART